MLGRGRSVLARSLTQRQPTHNGRSVHTNTILTAAHTSKKTTPTPPSQPTRDTASASAAPSAAPTPAKPAEKAESTSTPVASTPSPQHDILKPVGSSTPGLSKTSEGEKKGGGSDTPPPPPPKPGMLPARKVLVAFMVTYVAVAAYFVSNDEAREWAWKKYPKICEFCKLPLPKTKKPNYGAPSPTLTTTPTPVAKAAAPVESKPVAAKPVVSDVKPPIPAATKPAAPVADLHPNIHDPVVKARIDEALKLKPAEIAPVAPATVTTKPSVVIKPTAPVATLSPEPAVVPAAAARDVPSVPVTPAERVKLSQLISQLAASEREVFSFLHDQDSSVLSELSALEAELKDRELRHLQSLAVEQQYTLQSAIHKQDLALFRASQAKYGPKLKEFKESRLLEEENRWRAKLYDALKEQNTAMSMLADGYLQEQEHTKRTYYATYISRLKNASEALGQSRIKELGAKLSLAKHIELRSKQAHKLSSALLALSEVADKNHVSFEQPWKVVQQVAKEDETLAKAVALVHPDSVRLGVYSPAALKQAFQAISYDVKHTTFLPDRNDLWSVGREAVAHIFAALTLSESGGVIIPVHAAAATPSTPGAPLTRSGATALDSAHQEADYAHFINASTYLNSNALSLALDELEAMQPARQAIMARFIEELRKTVGVTEAIKVVRMRVLALNAAAAKA